MSFGALMGNKSIFGYRAASGQVMHTQFEEIKNIFQLEVVSYHEKYLGLPSMIGRKG